MYRGRCLPGAELRGQSRGPGPGQRRAAEELREEHTTRQHVDVNMATMIRPLLRTAGRQVAAASRRRVHIESRIEAAGIELPRKCRKHEVSYLRCLFIVDWRAVAQRADSDRGPTCLGALATWRTRMPRPRLLVSQLYSWGSCAFDWRLEMGAESGDRPALLRRQTCQLKQREAGPKWAHSYTTCRRFLSKLVYLDIPQLRRDPRLTTTSRATPMTIHCTYQAICQSRQVDDVNLCHSR